MRNGFVDKSGGATLENSQHGPRGCNKGELALSTPSLKSTEQDR